jgi:enoyl-CoA hydratase/carnithine racemase
MSEVLVKTEQAGPVLWITLNQGRIRNPLSSQMIASLTQALASGYEDDRCRVIVLAAEGPVFSSGHDLKEMHPKGRRRERCNQASYRQYSRKLCGLNAGYCSGTQAGYSLRSGHCNCRRLSASLGV